MRDTMFIGFPVSPIVMVTPIGVRETWNLAVAIL